MALTTPVSQNLGAKQYDRVKKGIRFGIGCSAIIAETVALLIFCFSPTLIGLFHQRRGNPSLMACCMTHDHAVLLPAGVFALYGGNLPWRGQIDRADARHAAVLVYHPRRLCDRCQHFFPDAANGFPGRIRSHGALSTLVFTI